MTTAPVAVIAAPLARPVTSAAHAIRTTIVSVLATGAIVLACLRAFTVAYGVDHRPFDGLPQTPPAGAPVERLVLEQQARGLTCRPEAALTDRVVFQHGAGDAAALVTLREAVAAQKAGSGSIQRYCF